LLAHPPTQTLPLSPPPLPTHCCCLNAAGGARGRGVKPFRRATQKPTAPSVPHGRVTRPVHLGCPWASGAWVAPRGTTVGIKVLTTNRCPLSTLQLQRSLLQPQVCRLCGASCGRVFFSCTVLHGPCLCCAIPQGLRLLRPCLVHVAPCLPPSL
jgi:hypothetical protein